MDACTRKLRADSAWGKLTPEQSAKLEAWLFEEKLSYEEVLTRARAEFGITSSLSSLAQFYQYLARERRFADLADTDEWLATDAFPPGSRTRLNDGLKLLLGRTAYQLALEAPDKLRLKELAFVMQSYLQLQRQEVLEKRLRLERDRTFLAASQTAADLTIKQKEMRGVTPEELHSVVEMLGKEMPHYIKMSEGAGPTPKKPRKKG